MQRQWTIVNCVGAAAVLTLPMAGMAQVAPPVDRPPVNGPMSVDTGIRHGLPPMSGSLHGGLDHDGPGIPAPGHAFPGPDSAGPLQQSLLRGLELDEVQADKVFEILHAQAPAVRNATKDLRKANDELRILARSDAYDAPKARALADAASRASRELTLLRADADHRIWSVLTPQQRRQADALPRPPRMPDR